MRKRILGACVLVLLCSATPTSAQSAPAVDRGTRVRLVAAAVSPEPLVGTIVRLDQTSLELWLGRTETVVVPREAITKIEVSLGRRSHAKKGALAGAALGAIAVLVTPDKGCSGLGCVEVPKALGVAVIGVLGAGVGALIGLSPQERWTPVPSGLQVSIAPARRGGVLSLSITF